MTSGKIYVDFPIVSNILVIPEFIKMCFVFMVGEAKT